MTKEIHPLARVKRKNNKIIIILTIISIINLSIFLYLYFDDLKNMFTKEEIKKEIKITQKNKESQKKINFPQINFSIDEIYFSKLSENINLQGNIKFKENNNPSQKSSESPKENKEIENKPQTSTETSLKKDFAYYYDLAKKAESLGDIKSALSFYHKAYKFNPDNDILYKIAYLNYKIGAYFGAEKYSKKIIQSNPNYIDAYILLANTYSKKKDLEKAILTLEEAYYQFPDNEKIIRELANFYKKAKNFYAAAELYEILSKKGDLKDIIETGKLYESIGNKEKALFYYKKALEKDRGTYKVWLEDKISKLSH